MEKNKEVFIIYLSERGRLLAEQVKAYFDEAELLKWDFFRENITTYWKANSLLIFIMALGIVARTVASLISKKGEDPGIIVLDELGSNVIPYLGGHYAETNKIALELATILRAHPCITTASDLKGLPALDLWIKKKGFVIKNAHLLPSLMNKFNTNRELKVWMDKEIALNLPEGLKETKDIEEADFIITFRKGNFQDKVVLIPKKLWAGIGFHETLTEEDLANKIFQALYELNLDFSALKGLATHKKKASYVPLINFALKHNLKLLDFDSDKLSEINTVSFSEKAKNIFGVNSICEASALLASNGILLVPKQVYKDFTIAIAMETFQERGKIYIVGIGPGNTDYLTLKALRVLTSVEAIVGYKTYLKHISKFLSGKEVHSFSMTEEVERVKKAVQLAMEGKDTALISGGDPGIYGMSGLLLEYLVKHGLSLEVEIVPGLSALNLGNALLGAPLANDFAVISLSDRLTPWETIEKRLTLLAQTDLPIVIYNPRSKGRKGQFSKAMYILKKFRDPKTYVGIINSASRAEEEVIICTLGEFPEDKVGMNSLIIIGSEAIKRLGQYLIAERGYERKYQEKLQNSPLN